MTLYHTLERQTFLIKKRGQYKKSNSKSSQKSNLIKKGVRG